MLDHEDRVAELLAELADQLRDLVRLDRVHPGRGLVEQEQPRVRRHRARDLEPAAVRVGERVRGLVPAVAHQALRRRTRASPRRARRSRAPRGACRACAAPSARCRRCVWPYAAAITFSLTVMFRNSRRVWKVRAMPLRVILFGGRPTIDSPSKRMSPSSGRVDAGDEVEERRLAGAVRADHADDLVLVDVQVEVGDHLQAAERLRDALQLEQRRAIRRSPPWPSRTAPAA